MILLRQFRGHVNYTCSQAESVRGSVCGPRRPRASQSYDHLETDHYAAINIARSSRHGYVSDDDSSSGSNGDDDRYAKIRPRTRPGQLQEPGERMVTSKSQDMWAAPASRCEVGGWSRATQFWALLY